MRNLLFAYINAKTKSQIRCAVHVTAQLIGAYVLATEIIQYNTSVLDPDDSFIFATRLIFNYNDKQPFQEGLSACSQCVGIGKLGRVKAIH